MRNLLALGAAGVLGFAGIGWYLGWYKIQATPTATGEDITIKLNTPKIKQDVNRGEEKVHDYLSKDGQTTSNSPPAPTSGTPTGFQRGGDGSLVYPGSNNVPPPLPPPPVSNVPVLPPPPLPQPQ